MTLARVTELSGSERGALRVLSLAVYPPVDAAGWSGGKLEWAAAEWCVRIQGADGTLASYVGISLRDAQHDGRLVRVGGVGGVKTHPAARGRGLAARAMQRAVEFFREQPDVAFAVLVCGAHLIEYYRGLGWREFGGRLLVRQHGAMVEFTFNRVMTLGVRLPGPQDGTIDLLGPPW